MSKAQLLAASAQLYALLSGAPATPRAQAPDNPPLQTLTVPPDRLGSACRLTPSDTVPLDGGSFRAGLWGGPPIAGNPWRGSDRKVAGSIRQRIAGSPELPDGPPLSRSELARFQSQLVEDVEEAYAAVYGVGDMPGVTVYAIRFNRLPVPAPPKSESSRRTLRIVRDRTVIVVPGGGSSCSNAVRGYITEVTAR